MGSKIKLDNDEYEIDTLSEHAQSVVESLKFATSRVEELQNMQALLQKAKLSYIDDLKKEMLSQMSGLVFEDD